MPSTRVVEAVDVFEDCHLGLSSCLPRMSSEQFCFDTFEEGLDGSIVIAIAFSAHRHPEAVLAQDLLIVVRAVLRPAICVVIAAFGW